MIFKHKYAHLIPLILLCLTISLSACNTLEVSIIPGTEQLPAETSNATAAAPASETPTATEMVATPTPYIDHWTLTTLPSFGITLERPPDWEAEAGYADDSRFSGVNGFLHISAMNAASIDDAAEAQAGHHLQPYGSQPIIENIEVQGQAARLITPSDDQTADFSRQAAVIVRYPQSVEIDGQPYNFLILWADQEHIRAIAQTVRFIASTAGIESPTPQAPIAWESLPPGLVFSSGAGLNLIDATEQPVLLHNDPQAVLSPDGSRLLTYDATQQDVWMLDRAEGAIWRLTDTPERPECCLRWWPGRPDVVLFQSTPVGTEGPQSGAPAYLTTIGINGQGYHILDPEHAFGLGQFAPSPDGQTIAYSDGETAWLYRWGGAERFDPADYGLMVEGGAVQINQPAWSPDGQRLAWIVKAPLAVDGGLRVGVALFELESRTAQVLHPYEPQGAGWPAAPVWSLDGTWLAFGDSSASERAGLWIARAAGETPEEREERHLGLGGNPVWSPDGRWLAFQSVGEDGLLTYAALNVETWERRTLNLPADRYGQLVDWIRLPPDETR